MIHQGIVLGTNWTLITSTTLSSGYYARTCSEFNVCGPLSPLASPPSSEPSLAQLVGVGPSLSLPCSRAPTCVWAAFVQLYIFLPFVLPATSHYILPKSIYQSMTLNIFFFIYGVIYKAVFFIFGTKDTHVLYYYLPFSNASDGHN